MKAVMIMFDTLNRHMLPAYGCQWTHMPNFKRLQEKTVVFDKCYVGSMPCMPARRELHTGRLNFLHRSWGPLEPFDDSMPEILKNNNIYTHLISDHQHYWEDGGCTYHNRYSSWEVVRGQEGDPWKAAVKDPAVPEHRGLAWRQDLVNRGYMDEESKQPQAQTFTLGLEFLEKNHKEDDWFLQLETFDPHEPYFTQEHYKALYPREDIGVHYDWPDYKPKTEEDEPYIDHIRLEYAALLSMCDHHLGRILDFFDEHNMWEDTMLIVNTDHGFLLGEHDWFAKCRMPFYEEISHTPLFIWDPRCQRRNERCPSLVQTIDFAPTLLEYFHVDVPEDMQGKVLRDAIAHDEQVREALLFGIFGGHVNCTDGQYVYMRAAKDSENGPLYEYTLMPTHMRSMFSPEELQHIDICRDLDFTKGCDVMKIDARQKSQSNKGNVLTDSSEFGTLLYDLAQDPWQQEVMQNKEIEDRMKEHMITLMKENNSPSEQYIRLGL